MPSKDEIVVSVSREDDGQLISEVLNKTKSTIRIRSGLVVDRATGRGPIDNKGLISRAKFLAELLSIPYEEDLEWRCCRPQKRFCKCPKCISEGRA